MDWTVLVVAVITGFAGVLTAVFSGLTEYLNAFFKVRKRKLEEGVYSKGLYQLAAFNAILEEFKRIPSAQRVMVFLGQNGGGVPSAGKEYTVRCIDGFSIKGGDPKSCFERFNYDLKVDPDYCFLIEELVRTKKVRIPKVADMHEGSILKEIYTNEGVASAVTYFLKLEDNKLYYLSVCSYDKEFTNTDMLDIDIIVYRLRGIL